jgi:hypothetical protein
MPLYPNTRKEAQESQPTKDTEANSTPYLTFQRPQGFILCPGTFSLILPSGSR